MYNPAFFTWVIRRVGMATIEELEKRIKELERKFENHRHAYFFIPTTKPKYDDRMRNQ